jgi:hypothetical protein
LRELAHPFIIVNAILPEESLRAGAGRVFSTVGSHEEMALQANGNPATKTR